MERNGQDGQIERDASDAVSRALAQASSHARQGDFRSARLTIERARTQVDPIDRERLDAFDRSFRLDRAACVVVAVTLVALAVIALLSLFN